MPGACILLAEKQRTSIGQGCMATTAVFPLSVAVHVGACPAHTPCMHEINRPPLGKAAGLEKLTAGTIFLHIASANDKGSFVHCGSTSITNLYPYPAAARSST